MFGYSQRNATSNFVLSLSNQKSLHKGHLVSVPCSIEAQQDRTSMYRQNQQNGSGSSVDGFDSGSSLPPMMSISSELSGLHNQLHQQQLLQQQQQQQLQLQQQQQGSNPLGSSFNAELLMNTRGTSYMPVVSSGTPSENSQSKLSDTVNQDLNSSSDDLNVALQYAQFLNMNRGQQSSNSFPPAPDNAAAQQFSALLQRFGQQSGVDSGGAVGSSSLADSSAFTPRPINPSFANNANAPSSTSQDPMSLNPALLFQSFGLDPNMLQRNNQVNSLLSGLPQAQEAQWPQLDAGRIMMNLPQGLQLQTQQMGNQPQSQGGAAISTNGQVSPKKHKRIYRHESFPEKLYRMLTELEEQGKDDIASFIGNGKSFQIHQPQAFEDEVISHYFRHSKLASFKRQLSMYGFTRVTGGTDHGSYTHPMFSKGRPDLCKQMDRVS